MKDRHGFNIRAMRQWLSKCTVLKPTNLSSSYAKSNTTNTATDFRKTRLYFVYRRRQVFIRYLSQGLRPSIGIM